MCFRGLSILRNMDTSVWKHNARECSISLKLSHAGCDCVMGSYVLSGK